MTTVYLKYCVIIHMPIRFSRKSLVLLMIDYSLIGKLFIWQMSTNAFFGPCISDYQNFFMVFSFTFTWRYFFNTMKYI